MHPVDFMKLIRETHFLLHNKDFQNVVPKSSDQYKRRKEIEEDR